MAKRDDRPVKVISNGQGIRTKVLLPDGTDITQYCRRITWLMEPPDYVGKVIVEFVAPSDMEFED